MKLTMQTVTSCSWQKIRFCGRVRMRDRGEIEVARGESLFLSFWYSLRVAEPHHCFLCFENTNLFKGDLKNTWLVVAGISAEVLRGAKSITGFRTLEWSVHALPLTSEAAEVCRT